SAGCPLPQTLRSEWCHRAFIYRINGWPMFRFIWCLPITPLSLCLTRKEAGERGITEHASRKTVRTAGFRMARLLFTEAIIRNSLLTCLTMARIPTAPGTCVCAMYSLLRTQAKCFGGISLLAPIRRQTLLQQQAPAVLQTLSDANVLTA